MDVEIRAEDREARTPLVAQVGTQGEVNKIACYHKTEHDTESQRLCCDTCIVLAALEREVEALAHEIGMLIKEST